MTPHDKMALLKALDTLAAFANSIPVEKECITCINYKSGICRLAEQAPPDHIKSVGCKEWRFDHNSAPF